MKRNLVDAQRVKINRIIDKQREKLKFYFPPGKNITIDELLNGVSFMIFYIPLKTIKCGFTIICMIDVETNYLYNFFLTKVNSIIKL